MIKVLFGTKIGSTRKFSQSGEQVPVTELGLPSLVVAQIKTQNKDGYNALQLGITRKRGRINKAQIGHLKGAKMKKAPLFWREVRVDDISKFELGQKIKPAEVLRIGDLVKVTGISKGKGFTGVMKRWGFHGGPRTHGQSDRERAPGSIGQTTTPGRVFKGKKMPGRSGGQKVAIKNLLVLGLDEEKKTLLVKGLVPGVRGSLLAIEKTGARKNFTPLLKEGGEITGFKEKKKALPKEAKVEGEEKPVEVKTSKESQEEKEK